MAEIFSHPRFGTPHGATEDRRPCDVEPPCEELPGGGGSGCGLERVAANLPTPIDPTHYRQGNVETIEIIEHVIAGYPTHLAYHIGNVLKYLCRAPYKHNTVSEDLRKASWYLNRAVSKL